MTELTTIRQILLRDPIWSVYAIADLQPALAPHCHWSVINSDQGAAVLLLFTVLQPPILLATGDGAAVAEALTNSLLPEQVYVAVRLEHYPLLNNYYTWVEDPHPMVRMVLHGGAPVMPMEMPTTAKSAVVRLYPADATAIADLYRQGGPFTPDFFDPYQLDDGVFYGVKDAQGVLRAVGGTHVIAWQEGMSVIGNMYTDPAARGKGYARAVLGAIITELQARNVTTIILNVDERNATARGLYERYGFVPAFTYMEAEGVKRKQ